MICLVLYRKLDNDIKGIIEKNKIRAVFQE